MINLFTKFEVTSIFTCCIDMTCDTKYWKWGGLG